MSDERAPTPPDAGPTELEQTDNRPREDDPAWADQLPQGAGWRPELEEDGR